MGFGGSSAQLPDNLVGITTALDPTAGAIDGSGDSYLASATSGLGNTVTWGSQTFNIGPAGVNDLHPDVQRLEKRLRRRGHDRTGRVDRRHDDVV